MSSKVKKVMTQPISVIFRMLQGKQRLQIWLYEQTNVRCVRIGVIVSVLTYLFAPQLDPCQPNPRPLILMVFQNPKHFIDAIGSRAS